MKKSPAVLKVKLGEAVDILAADKSHAEGLRKYNKALYSHGVEWTSATILTSAITDSLRAILECNRKVEEPHKFIGDISSANEIVDRVTDGFLSDRFLFDIHPSKYDSTDIAECKKEARSFKAFLKKRYVHLRYGMSEVEKRYVESIEFAIEHLEETNNLNFYVNFKRAVNAYTIWFNQRLYRFELYIVYLLKKLIATGIIFDFRERLRDIMRFLFKNLDDEDTLNNKIHRQSAHFFYCLKYNYHEPRKYNFSN